MVAEYRYRMAGKIRPLLFFWITKDGIGGARIRVRRGEDGASGLDLLIGSDPTRAPRGINRWGYILEETRGDETTVVGIMKKSDEDTLDQATSNVAREAHGEVDLQDDPGHGEPGRVGGPRDRRRHVRRLHLS